MEIISVGENDWDDLRTIRLASLKDSPNAFAVSYETALNYTEAEWRVRASGAADRSFFIAKVDSLFVGIVGGLHGREEYELISMWVSPNHRENGIAKALINKSVAHAKNLKKVSIFLEVTSNNMPPPTFTNNADLVWYLVA